MLRVRRIVCSAVERSVLPGPPASRGRRRRGSAEKSRPSGGRCSLPPADHRQQAETAQNQAVRGRLRRERRDKRPLSGYVRRGKVCTETQKPKRGMDAGVLRGTAARREADTAFIGDRTHTGSALVTGQCIAPNGSQPGE